MSAITATTEKAAGHAARARLRLLAAFLPVTAALYIGAEDLEGFAAALAQLGIPGEDARRA